MADQPAQTVTPTVTPAHAPSVSGVAPAAVQKKAFNPRVQLKRGLQLMSFDEQASLLSPNPVQLRGDGGAESVHAAAAHGIASGGGAMPHGDKIQSAFGAHDVSGIQAHTGSAAKDASQAMGAEAYATGNHVVFGGAPDLHTAAHEAAHVVQQGAGVSLSDGVGKSGDSYEQHADAVADAVVSGKSAEPILNQMTGGSAGGGVQQRATQMKAVQLMPVQMVGPGPGAPPATTTPAPTVDPLKARKDRLTEKLNAAKAAKATASTKDALLQLTRDATDARSDAEFLIAREPTNTDYPRNRDEAAALREAGLTGQGFFTGKTNFEAATTSSQMNTHLTFVRGKLTASADLTGLAAVGNAWLTQNEPLVAKLTEVETKVQQAVTEAGAALQHAATVGQTCKFAQTALTQLHGVQAAFDANNTRLSQASVQAKTTLKTACDPKMARVVAGDPSTLTRDDFVLLSTALPSLEELGEAPAPGKEHVPKINDAISAKSSIDHYGETAPDTGATIAILMDSIEPQLVAAKVGPFESWLRNHLRTLTQSRVEPKLLTHLTNQLTKFPEGVSADEATTGAVGELDRFIRDADAEAAKGRITLVATNERARIAEAQACLTINAEFTALAPLEQLASEALAKADEQRENFVKTGNTAVQTILNKFRQIASPFVSFFRMLKNRFFGKTISAEEKQQIGVEFVQSVSAMTDFISPGGLIEMFLGMFLKKKEQDQTTTGAAAFGQGNQVTGDAWQLFGEAIEGALGVSLPQIEGTLGGGQFGLGAGEFMSAIGKGIQKSGEGYGAVASVAFGLGELASNLVAAIFPAWGAAGTVADFVGSCAGAAELVMMEQIQTGDRTQILDFKTKLDGFTTRWEEKNFSPMAAHGTLLTETTERFTEVEKKLGFTQERKAG